MKVGIAGFGVIGKGVAKALLKGLPNLMLDSVASGSKQKAADALASIGASADIVTPEELASRCDIIVECAPTDAFSAIAVPALAAGRILLTVSAAAIIRDMSIVEFAQRHGGRIVLATGALLGLDAVRAAAEGVIHSVDMVTRKPPRSLLGAPHLVENGIDITNLSEPLLVFEGSARDGARGFPANVNVAASLALAGIGPDATRLQIWADPTKVRNTHTIKVDADSARFEMTIENIPSVEKPGTGKITALSVVAALRGLAAPLRVGT